MSDPQVTPNQLLEIATERHRAADLPQARRLYRQVLEQSPTHAPALFRLGLLHLQEGELQPALEQIQKAIAASPDDLNFQLGLGEVLMASQRPEEAAVAYQRALEIQPESAAAHFGLGRVLQAQGAYTSAIGSFRSAIQCQPASPDAFNHLGNCHQLLGNLPAAEAAYRQALILRKDDASAMSNLGTVLLATGRVDDAILLLRQAAELEPTAASHVVNLAAALARQEKFAEAVAILAPVIQRDPNNPQAHFNLANALRGLGRLSEAANHYRIATTRQPDYADAFNNLGSVHKELGEFGQAMAAYESAIVADPASATAMNNAGCLLRTLGRHEEAETLLRRGLNYDPKNPALHNNLGNVLKDVGELDEALHCFRAAISLDPTDWQAHSNLAYALSFQAIDPQPILEECRRWNQQHAALMLPKTTRPKINPVADRRLRIGYVSPDFRDHCQSLFTIPLLSHHDHNALEIFCYSSVERPDDFTRRIAGYADHWREVRHRGDAALADLIRADQIDILVDLTMHMADARPLVFAAKPAPIQVAWLAYPGTTGMDAIDYRLSDPRLDPPGFDNHYTERTIRLPDSFWCYDPLTSGPLVNDLPALSRGHITFGCLNNPCKISDRTLALWAPVLRDIENSRLLLLSPPGPHRQRLQQRLAGHAIAPARVDFLPFRPRDQYLATYHDIDLGLDTFPYNGHTTSLDSMWMGVPVVTRVGQTCVGRGGLSQLFQLGLLNLAAETDKAFVDTAIALAKDLPGLAALRQQLRKRLENSPLMDAARFARNIEAAYRQMLQG